MKLDLALLAPRHRDQLNAIAIELRQPFNDLVRRLGARHANAIDWWVTSIASRNIFSCTLFLRCCQFVLALRVANNDDQLREIVVDTPGLVAALTAALDGKSMRIMVRPHRGILPGRVRLYAGMTYRWAAAAFHAVNQVVWARIFPASRRFAPSAPVILVDTFLYHDSFERDYRDRHYPGMLDCLSEAQRQQVFFLPTYYKIRNYPRLFRALRLSPVNFLVKEDFLRIVDYAYALAHPLRTLGFAVDHSDFEGVDIAPMVNEALRETFASSGSIEGLLRYRLALRLQEAGVPVKHLVDWFENQEVDHGSNAGFRRYLPQTPITGYQGFVVSRHYLCMFPTREELRLGLIPHRVAVMGTALVQAAQEFCPELPVGVAPAFRFAGVWNHGAAWTSNETFRILIALPLMREESTVLLALLTAAALEFPSAEGQTPWLVRVKAHPSMTEALPTGFICVEGDIDVLLEDSDVLVSSASSVCVQALAHGIPVIIVGSANGLTLNPIPPEAERDMWDVCYTASEIGIALRRYAERDGAAVARHRDCAAALRERYFSPVTSEAVRAFLMLEPAAQAMAAESGV